MVKQRKLVLIGLAIVAVCVVYCIAGKGNADKTKHENGKEQRAQNRKARKAQLVGQKGTDSVARQSIDNAMALRTNRLEKGTAKLRAPFSRDPEETWCYDDGRPWPKEQLELRRAIADSMEHDNYAELSKLAPLALDSPIADVREAMVDALGWFGDQALTELTVFMSDKDEDVAEAAATHWKMGLQEIESEAEKVGLIAQTLQVFKDKDMLEDIANELVGMDEVLAIQMLVDTIGGDNPAAIKTAIETYEFITDEKWSDIDAAEAWLQENYDQPDELLNHADAPSGAADANEAGGNADAGDEVDGGTEEAP